MKHVTRNKRKRGFTIIELVVAIFIITIGLVAAASLMSYSISAVIIGKSQIIATDLAQEGLEVVRNIRDNNWHCIADSDCSLTGGDDWKDGLDGCSAGCRVIYSSASLLFLAGNPVLKINDDGYYQYALGDNTRFYRKITITDNPDGDPATDDIKVTSEVSFSERGRSYSVSAEDRLYDWK